MNQPVIHADQGSTKISRHLYGHFAEHLGTGIYEGLWVGEDSPIPNIIDEWGTWHLEPKNKPQVPCYISRIRPAINNPRSSMRCARSTDEDLQIGEQLMKFACPHPGQVESLTLEFNRLNVAAVASRLITR